MCCFVSAIAIVVTAIAILNGHYTDICAIDSIDLECHKKDISFLSISTSLCMVILETCRSVDPYILKAGVCLGGVMSVSRLVFLMMGRQRILRGYVVGAHAGLFNPISVDMEIFFQLKKKTK